MMCLSMCSRSKWNLDNGRRMTRRIRRWNRGCRYHRRNSRPGCYSSRRMRVLFRYSSCRLQMLRPNVCSKRCVFLFLRRMILSKNRKIPYTSCKYNRRWCYMIRWWRVLYLYNRYRLRSRRHHAGTLRCVCAYRRRMSRNSCPSLMKPMHTCLG